MIWNEELSASLDQSAGVVVFHRIELSRAQQLAQTVADKVGAMVEQGEKTLDLKLGGSGGWSDRADGNKGDKRGEQAPSDRRGRGERIRGTPRGKFGYRMGNCLDLTNSICKVGHAARELALRRAWETKCKDREHKFYPTSYVRAAEYFTLVKTQKFDPPPIFRAVIELEQGNLIICFTRLNVRMQHQPTSPPAGSKMRFHYHPQIRTLHYLCCTRLRSLQVRLSSLIHQVSRVCSSL
jgi:hypothetical protein